MQCCTQRLLHFLERLQCSTSSVHETNCLPGLVAVVSQHNIGGQLQAAPANSRLLLHCPYCSECARDQF